MDCGKLCEGNGGENERRANEQGETARDVCDATEGRRDEKVEKRWESVGPTICRTVSRSISVTRGLPRERGQGQDCTRANPVS